MSPARMTTAPAQATSLAIGSGPNAATATSGAGAIASRSDHQVAPSGSTLSRAAIVISCAAPARSSALRRHGQLGGVVLRHRLSGAVCGVASGAVWAVVARS